VKWDVILAEVADVLSRLVASDTANSRQTHTCWWTVLGLWRNKLRTDRADDEGYSVYRRRLVHWPRKWLVSWLFAEQNFLPRIRFSGVYINQSINWFICTAAQKLDWIVFNKGQIDDWDQWITATAKCQPIVYCDCACLTV